MTITIKFSKSVPKTCDTVVALCSDKAKLPASLKDLDKSVKGYISDALKDTNSFSGKAQETATLTLPKNKDVKTVILAGIGKEKDLNELEAEKTGAAILKALESAKSDKTTIYTDIKSALSEDILAARLAHGMDLRAYKFDKYRPKPSKDKAPKKITVTLVGDKSSQATKLYDRLNAVHSGVVLARDLVNEAPNALYPDSYAKLIKKELEALGVKVEILDEKKLEKMGMGAILAVGQGSSRQPRMVIMQWNGSGKKMSRPLGFVGKGVTFDTGGISIKPADGMDLMKMDMGGSAAVVGLMKALAAQNIKKDVIGIVGLAENMPSANAYRPGDIVKSYSGKHVEVLNTDAEGRLVLADCLTHIQKEYDPALIVDLATLTGAIMVALAYEYTGVFANDDNLWNGLNDAGTRTGEKVWRMPLDEAYRKDVESDIGDVRNLARNGRMGGACTAAAFLEHFIDENRTWAHMDIAATAFVKNDLPLGPKGATGVGVRLLECFVHDYK